MKRILFQGDSITDGNRTRGTDQNHIIGHSYPYPIATKMGFENPGKYEFLNRGCSGDTVCNLYARWHEDAIALKPDVISILIGVNDADKRCSADKNVYIDVYEKTYRLLLENTLKVKPDTKFIILEPFTLDTGNMPHYKELENYVFEYAKISRKIADDFDAVFVPLQQRFNEALKKAPVEYWIWDSIHPTYNGHGLIADAFLKDTQGLF